MVKLIDTLKCFVVPSTRVHKEMCRVVVTDLSFIAKNIAER